MYLKAHPHMFVRICLAVGFQTVGHCFCQFPTLLLGRSIHRLLHLDRCSNCSYFSFSLYSPIFLTAAPAQLKDPNHPK